MYFGHISNLNVHCPLAGSPTFGLIGLWKLAGCQHEQLYIRIIVVKPEGEMKN